MHQLLQFRLLSGSNGLAHHDAGRRRSAVCDHGEHLIGLHGDGVGRGHIAAQVPQDPRLHHLRRAPLGLIEQDGQGDPHIVPNVAGVDENQLFQRQAQLSLTEFQIIEDDQQLHAPGDQRGNGRAADAQLRKSEIAVDQQIVERNIDAQRGKGNDVSQLDNTHGA